MGESKSVLLIDDDKSLRRVVEYNLRQEGYDVLTAADGSNGLEQFHSQAVDVVLTDVRMPGIGALHIELPDEGLSLDGLERELLVASLEKHG